MTSAGHRAWEILITVLKWILFDFITYISNPLFSRHHPPPWFGFESQKGCVDVCRPIWFSCERNRIAKVISPMHKHFTTVQIATRNAIMVSRYSITKNRRCTKITDDFASECYVLICYNLGVVFFGYCCWHGSTSQGPVCNWTQGLF